MTNEEKILQILGEMRTENEKRFSRIEAAQSEMRDLLQKVAVTQEGIVLPRLDLLAEGHKHLADTLAPKSRVDDLESDVAMLKDVVKLMRMEITELKQAQ